MRACVACVRVCVRVCKWTLISNAGNTGFSRADCTRDYVNKLYIMIYRERGGVVSFLKHLSRTPFAGVLSYED